MSTPYSIIFSKTNKQKVTKSIMRMLRQCYVPATASECFLRFPGNSFYNMEDRAQSLLDGIILRRWRISKPLCTDPLRPDTTNCKELLWNGENTGTKTKCLSLNTGSVNSLVALSVSCLNCLYSSFIILKLGMIIWEHKFLGKVIWEKVFEAISL